MIPYFLVLTIGTFLAYLGRRLLGGRKLDSMVLFGVAFFLIAFSGLRDRTVGTDTGNYVGWFHRINSVEDALLFNIEKGYTLLSFLGTIIYDNYASVLLLTAVLVVGCYFKTIFAYVKRYELGIFVFISLGFFTFSFNGARQGIAIAICFLSLIFLIDRKLVPYLLLIALAMQFHKTAIVAVPLYFLAREKVGWREILFILLGMAIFTGFLSFFTQIASQFLDERFASYSQEHRGGGHVTVAFLLVQALLFFVFKKQVSEGERLYARLLNIYLFGLIPAVASVVSGVNPSGVLRLSGYFSHVAIILWPMVFCSYSKLGNKLIFGIGFSFCALLYFYLTTSAFSGLTPYRINMSVFS